MHRFLIPVFLSLFLVVLCAEAQGLKGLDGIHKRFGRINLVKGLSDKERWKSFSDLQPQLIGCPYRTVETALGQGASNKMRTELNYVLAEKPVKSGASETTWTYLSIFFRNGKAWKYTVEAK